MAQAKAKATGEDNRPTLESEFCRPLDLQRLFGMKRGQFYTLERRGLIKTVSLREKGNKRGTKLVSVSSVRAYLNGLLEKASAGTIAS